MEDVAYQDSYWGQVDIQGINITVPALHWMRHSGELDPSEAALRRVAPSPGSLLELALVGGVDNLAQGHECGRTGLPLICLEVPWVQR